MNIYVGNLSFRATDDSLRELFAQFGEVTSAKIMMDKMSGRSKGFGFVDMPDKMEALQTIDALHGAGIKGRKISVQKAEDKPGNSNYRSGDRFNKKY